MFLRLIFLSLTTWMASAFVVDVQQQQQQQHRTKALHRGTSSLYNSYLDSLTIPRNEAVDAVAESTHSQASRTAIPKGTVRDLQSVPDFLKLLNQAPQDSLVVIKFYGKSCPLCKKIEMKYKKMARTYASDSIQFAEIHNRVHPDLFHVLGVETFPYIHIYRNGQCVASHGTESDVTFESIVKDTIDRELAMSPEQWKSFLTAFAEPIQRATQRVENVRQWLQQEQE